VEGGRGLEVDRASDGVRRTLRDGGVSVNLMAICGTEKPHELACVLG
jgi:hypothetical protein